MSQSQFQFHSVLSMNIIISNLNFLFMISFENQSLVPVELCHSIELMRQYHIGAITSHNSYCWHHKSHSNNIHSTMTQSIFHVLVNEAQMEWPNWIWINNLMRETRINKYSVMTLRTNNLMFRNEIDSTKQNLNKW